MIVGVVGLRVCGGEGLKMNIFDLDSFGRGEGGRLRQARGAVRFLALGRGVGQGVGVLCP